MNDPTNLPIWRKWWARSKTVWLHLVAALAALFDFVKPYTDDLRGALGPHWFVFIILILSGAGLYLRHCTAGGLSATKAGES